MYWYFQDRKTRACFFFFFRNYSIEPFGAMGWILVPGSSALMLYGQVEKMFLRSVLLIKKKRKNPVNDFLHVVLLCVCKISINHVDRKQCMDIWKLCCWRRLTGRQSGVNMLIWLNYIDLHSCTTVLFPLFITKTNGITVFTVLLCVDTKQWTIPAPVPQLLVIFHPFYLVFPGTGISVTVWSIWAEDRSRRFLPDSLTWSVGRVSVEGDGESCLVPVSAFPTHLQVISVDQKFYFLTQYKRMSLYEKL